MSALLANRSEFFIPIAGRLCADFTDSVMDEESVLDSIRLPDYFSFQQRYAIISEIRQHVADATGHLAPVPEDDQAITLHTHGAPGSGKSFTLRQMHQTLIDANMAEWGVVSDDNIIANLSEWKKQLAKVTRGLSLSGSYQPRLEVRAQFLDATRVGSELVMNRFIADHISFFRDSTCSDEKTLQLADTLAKRNFKNMFVSVYSPYEVASKRAFARIRPVSLSDEIIGKRIGAYNMMPKLVNRAFALEDEVFISTYNPSNTEPPVMAFKVSHGVLVDCDLDVIARMRADMLHDLKHPDLFRDSDMQLATMAAIDVLDDIVVIPRVESVPTEPVLESLHQSPA